MLTRRKKIVVIVGSLLFLFLLFLLIWFLFRHKPVPSPAIGGQAELQTPPPRASEEEEPAAAPAEKIDVSLQSLAVTFVERYGSYSSESEFANLYDVMDLMTASLKAQTEAFITSAKMSEEYYGVTTRVLSTDVLSSSETSAAVEASTQREESKGSPQNSEVSYKKLLLNCVKEDGLWKVASAVWQ
jgi:hypothetical protein